MPTHINTPALAKELLDNNDTFLFDCDGVLWRGSTLLPHTKEMLKLLRDNNKQVVFVTNNSTKSRKQYVSKFEKLGVDASKVEIFGSAYSVAVYLSNSDRFDKSSQKAFVVGEQGLVDELEEAGISTVGGADPHLNSVMSTEEEAKLAKRDSSIGAVVTGLDSHINYLKFAIAQAQLLKNDKECLFVATNIDSTFPSSAGVMPGAGTIVEAVATCSNRRPDAILGKPSKAMMDSVKLNFNLNPSRTVMVGDRLNTDMHFGKDSGLNTLFVLSGVDNLESLPKADVDPTYYAENLGSVYELLQ